MRSHELGHGSHTAPRQVGTGVPTNMQPMPTRSENGPKLLAVGEEMYRRVSSTDVARDDYAAWYELWRQRQPGDLGGIPTRVWPALFIM